MNDKRDTCIIDDTPKNQNTFSCIYFKDLEEAKEYAMENSGSTFVKNHNGPGYIIKDNIKHDRPPSSVLSWKDREANLKDNEITQRKPVRSGLSWKDDEIARLIKLHSSGQNISQISNELERSLLSVSSKLSNLELISKEEHQKYLDAHLSTHS